MRERGEGRRDFPPSAPRPVRGSSGLFPDCRRASLERWPAGWMTPHTHRRSTMADPSQFNTDRTYPDRWTISFSNPPINIFDPATIVELGALMSGLEADPSVKVVVFQSANPDFFVAHLDVSKAAERPEVLGLWR